jgi:hypothetical protein
VAKESLDGKKNQKYTKEKKKISISFKNDILVKEFHALINLLPHILLDGGKM